MYRIIVLSNFLPAFNANKSTQKPKPNCEVKVLSCNFEESFKRFPDPHPDADEFHNLYEPSYRKIQLW